MNLDFFCGDLIEFGACFSHTGANVAGEKLPSGLQPQQLKEFQSVSVVAFITSRGVEQLKGSCRSCDQAVFSPQKRDRIPGRWDRFLYLCGSGGSGNQDHNSHSRASL